MSCLGIMLLLSIGVLGPSVAVSAPGPFSRLTSKGEARQAFQNAATLLTNQGPTGLRALFSSWKSQFQVSYNATEDTRRFNIFVDNVRKIIATNNDDSVSHFAGVNQFTAWTHEEFKARMLQPQGQKLFRNVNTEAPKAVGAIPTNIDWRLMGKVTEIKNQKSCGSCWAFAGAAAIESKVLIYTGKTFDTRVTNVSEQQFVDCATGSGYNSYGCAGGTLEDPFVYATRKDLAPESLYPYNAVDQSCLYNSLAIPAAQKVRLTGAGYGSAAVDSATALKQAIAIQPTVVGFYASDPTFQYYAGGVYAPAGCGAGHYTDHAMLGVGYSTLNNVDVFIIKNSWSTAYKGYLYAKVLTDTYGTCQMYQDGGVYPTDPIVPDGPAPSPSPSAPSPSPSPAVPSPSPKVSPSPSPSVPSPSPKVSPSPSPSVPSPSPKISPSPSPSVPSPSPKVSPSPSPSVPSPSPKISPSPSPLLPSPSPSPARDYTFRLVSGPDARSGRLEVLYSGQYGTVCDDYFDHNAASVACYQLGLNTYGFATSIYPKGADSSQIWFDDTWCTGSESRLQDCQHGPIGVTDCTHAEDVGVICPGASGVTFRLSYYTNVYPTLYRLELGFNGVFGTVCSDFFKDNNNAASVVCRMFFGGGATGTFSPLTATSKPSYGSGQIWLTNVICQGNEYSMLDCRYPLLGQHNCKHSQDVGLICSGGSARKGVTAGTDGALSYLSLTKK